MSEWQPIETAPKDGTYLLTSDGKWREVCKFVDGFWCSDLEGESYSYVLEPTHWQPLPEPPPEDA